MEITFTKEIKKEIVDAIVAAESISSGEMRLHVDQSCEEEVLDRAVFVFDKLGMSNTDLKNGVLFYLSVSDKQFAVIGDKGIDNKVPEGFWDQVIQLVIDHFKKGDFKEGLIAGIQAVGKQLEIHFPYQSEDKNELSDEISFDNNWKIRK